MVIEPQVSLVPIAAICAIIGGFFGWLIQKNKGKVEETIAARGQWEKLNNSLSARLTNVEEEFAKHRIETAAEIAKMKTDHAAEIAAIKLNHAAEMKAMRELNEGLQRMISQHSKSSAYLMGNSPVTRGSGDGK